MPDVTRIIEQKATESIYNDDWLIKDSVTQGTTKIQPSVLKAWINDGMATDEELETAVDDTITKLSAVGSASGAIATFDDGSALPMPSLEVAIEPQQDLHGYDAPWVGGAGKNKLPMTVDGIKAVNTYHSWSGNSTTINNVTITIETDSDGNVTGIKFNGTASADITFNLASNITIPNGSYVWSNDKIVNISNLWLSLTSPNIAITLSNEKEKNVTVSNGSISSAYIYASSGNAFNNVVFKPMIRLASVTDATFAPYSNICPISGHTEANVTRCGKNLLASSTLVSNTYINQNTGEEVPYNGWTSTDYIPIEQNKWYRLLKLVDGSYAVNADATVYWACYDANLNFVRGSVGDGMKDFPSNAKWLRTSSQTALMNKAVLCEDSDVSSFVTESDYIDGTIYNVQFTDGDNPLTVYGGSLDVVSGELTVDRVFNTFTELPSQYADVGNDIVCAFIQSNNMKANSRNDGLSNYFFSTNTIIGQNNPWRVCFGINNKRIYFTFDPEVIGGNTLENINNYVAINPIQVVYPLATPLTIQLTSTQVKSLLGQNNIWADTGNVLAEYIRDATTIINSLIARIEALENQ